MKLSVLLILSVAGSIIKADEFNDFNICGRTNIEAKLQRIVGGEDADKGDLPWQAGVRPVNFTYLTFKPRCGATLISKKWAITAAHCNVSDSDEIVLGANDFSWGNEERAERQIKKVVRSIPHPGFNSATLVNDIMLVELESEVEFTDYVTPACIIAGDKDLAPGTEVVISGWGTLFLYGYQPNRLQKAKVKIISDRTCFWQYYFLKIRITDVMLCAAGYNVDSCNGDSGGPLVVNLKNKCGEDQFFLAGVVSFGAGCANSAYSGVYADVANLRGWVEQTLQVEGSVKASTAEHTCGGPPPSPTKTTTTTTTLTTTTTTKPTTTTTTTTTTQTPSSTTPTTTSPTPTVSSISTESPESTVDELESTTEYATDSTEAPVVDALISVGERGLVTWEIGLIVLASAFVMIALSVSIYLRCFRDSHSNGSNEVVC